MHWRSCFDSKYVGAWDLPRDRDAIVTIEKVGRDTLTGQSGKKDKKAILHLRGKSKPLACNITNAKIVAKMYGNDTRQWVGKSIALYVAVIDAFGESNVEAIRVRPRIPAATADAPSAPRNEPGPSVATTPETTETEDLSEEGAFDDDHRESA